MWFIKVGSRVTGPFSEDEMRVKRHCKELAPFHLVSRDRIRWESAAPLIKLLDGAQPEWKRPQPTVSGAGNGSDSRQDLAPTPSVQWYYVDSSRKQLGPIPQEALRDLIRTKRLSGRALACKVGDTQWEQARRYPELASAVPSGNRRTLAIAGSTIFGLAAVACIFLFLQPRPTIDADPTVVAVGDGLRDHQPAHRPTIDADPTVAETSSSSNRSQWQLLITSLSDEEKLSQAVGLVAVCQRKTYSNGRSEEILMSTGSCFAITSDGYLLTNRHVVSDHEELKPAKVQTKDGVLEIKIGHPVVVFFKKVRVEAKVIWISKRFDLAILKVDRQRPKPYFALGLTTKIPQETLVAVLGYPGAANKERSQEEVASRKARIIDAIQSSDKDLTIESQLLERHYNFSASRGYVDRLTSDADGGACIEHGARIMHGNSGGPLALKNGIVVGLNTAGKNDSEKSRIVIGTGKDKQVVEFDDKTESVHISYTLSQFRDEITENIPSGVIWKDQ